MKKDHCYYCYIKGYLPNDYGAYVIKLCEFINRFDNVKDIKNYINELEKEGAKIEYYYQKIW